MTQLIIVHVAEDATYAEELRQVLAEFKPSTLPVSLTSRPFMIGARVLMALVWSRAAEDAAMAQTFASFAEVNPGRTLILAEPGATLSLEMIVQRLPVTSLGGSEEQVKADVQAALAFARESDRPFTDAVYGEKMRVTRSGGAWRGSDAVQAHVAEQRSYIETFGGGVVRGLAGSIALAGLGGGVAIGLSEPGAALSLVTEGAPQSQTLSQTAEMGVVSGTVDADGLYMPFYGSNAEDGRLLGDEEMFAQARALSETLRAERPLIDKQLAEAVADLDAARKQSAEMVSRLAAIAGTGAALASSLASAEDVAPAPTQMAAVEPAAPVVQAEVQTVEAAPVEPVVVQAADIEPDLAPQASLVQIAAVDPALADEQGDFGLIKYAQSLGPKGPIAATRSAKPV